MTSRSFEGKMSKMMQPLFEKQKRQLDYFYSHLNLQDCEKLFEHARLCQGALILTGVGKSGFVAQKITSTLVSTGCNARFLSPLDALHGDLGKVSAEDLLIILSKSGETQEILEIATAARQKRAIIAAVTSNVFSKLAKFADCRVELPCQHELCPFDLAPTISTEIQLLFGDVFAIALMQARGFTLEEFALNHPAGRIGKRASLKVKDLMLSAEKTPFCHPTHRLQDVLVDFSNKKCGCLIVIDERRQLQGIFTDGDLRRALQKKGEKVLKESIHSLMTTSVKTISAQTLAWDAVKEMEADREKPCTVLPVVENDQVIGLIKMHDIIQAGI